MRWAALLGLVVVAVALVALRVEDEGPSPLAELPTNLAGVDGFASASRCRACHPSEYESWRGSYHRKMTEPAVKESVLAPFDAATLVWAGREYRVGKDGDTPVVEMPAFSLTSSNVPSPRLR